MKPGRKLQRQLDDLVRSIPASGRDHVERLIASVVQAGGISEDALVRMVANRDLPGSLRADLSWLLPRLKIEAAGPVLETLLSDPSEQVREAAAEGLGLVLEKDDVQALLDVLERDRSKPVRRAALHALGILSSPRSAARLMDILRNPEEDAGVRADAAEALAHVDDPRIVDVLMDALRDPSALVRYSAAYALGQQGDAKAIPVLREVAARDDATTPWGSVASRALDSIEKLAGRET